MSSIGDPATRLVVDLAAYQPIEDGVNLSIHNVRLQQICPAKKRRRFLRRRPAQNDATGASHVRKEGILIIGATAALKLVESSVHAHIFHTSYCLMSRERSLCRSCQCQASEHYRQRA